jgi:membrane protein DedA with SNARE-associated domain
MFLEKRAKGKRQQQFRHWFDRYGLLTVFISAMVPLPIMPMKIFVLCAGALGSRTGAFLMTFVGARIPRYLGLVLLGRAMGDNALVYLRGHVWHLTAFAAVLFAVLMTLVKMADRRRAAQISSSGVQSGIAP